jgi:DNA-binding winged helix-turn-helix (wHTH) protein/predicted ATPase
MEQGQVFIFHPFRLDTVSGSLWRGSRAIPLRPKTFAVLRYLVEHAGKLVTKDELLDAIWSDTYVSGAVPIVCIRELRKALGDLASAPRFIQAVPRRGYRFIAQVHNTEFATPPPKPYRPTRRKAPDWKPEGRFLSSQDHTEAQPVHLVGREAELARLEDWFTRAVHGKRQVVFVTGEPGIGKTALLDAFLERVAASHKRVWIGRGLCVEHYGPGEAYLPILDAFGQLCRGQEGPSVVNFLSHHAPTWLVQMPTLLGTTELDLLRGKTQGATRERMVREMAEAVEALTADRPLVLALEDLQWSDYSTVELIAFLARRRERARLLVLVSYRPMEILGSGHPLPAVVQELHAHGQCRELALPLLAEEDIAAYLAARFAVGGHVPIQEVARVIHQRTEGNPLFMVNATDYLLAQGVIQQTDGQWTLRADVREVSIGIPENLRQLIEKQFERLTPREQRVLEAASVAGVEFSAAAVATVFGEDVVQSEQICAALARRGQFLRPSGVSEWPDGTVAGGYAFIHTLYQNVLYEHLPPGQRLSFHRRIGERKEAGYGERAGEIAAELAAHFVQGRDYGRAVAYLEKAAENTLRRYGYREAIAHVTKGIELLKELPATPARDRQELALRVILGSSLLITKGYAALETESVYRRALELCQVVGEKSQLFLVLAGLFNVHLQQGRLQTACEVAAQLLTLARQEQDPAFLVWAHTASGVGFTHLGERLSARAHLEQALALYDRQRHDAIAGVVCLSYLASVLLGLGYAEQASHKVHEALALAEEQVAPFAVVYALVNLALFHLYHGEGQLAHGRAEAAIALAAEQGFAHWTAIGMIARGSALTKQEHIEEGILQMRQGLAAYQATGAQTGQPWFLALLAEGYGKAGQTAEGLKVLAEAVEVAQRIGEHVYDAELYRLKGELILQQFTVQSSTFAAPNTQPLTPSPRTEAEACLLTALEIARQQSAKIPELRAVISLSRLWRQQGKTVDARQMLADTYGWFTEGSDTPDLREARALLTALERAAEE